VWSPRHGSQDPTRRPARRRTRTCSTADNKSVGTHATAHEASAFHRQYLISIGLKPVGQTELIDPTDGCVRVLTKKIRFGARVRRGKGPEAGSAIGNRLADMQPETPRFLSL
jgi:hypothetical protein